MKETTLRKILSFGMVMALIVIGFGTIPGNMIANETSPEETISNWEAINQPPEADAGGPYAISEGTEIILDASASSDLDKDLLEYRWDFDNDGTWDTNWSYSPNVAYTWSDDHSGDVKVEVFDGNLNDTNTTTVTVNNIAPQAKILNNENGFENYILVTDYFGQSFFIDIDNKGSLASPQLIDAKDLRCYSAGIGDFDNDGDFDALVGERSNTWYYEKTGSGKDFASAVSIDSTLHPYRMDFAEADYNNDGNLDAVMADYRSDYFTIYMGNGNGTFIKSTLSCQLNIMGMDSADFNNDGNMDFIAASYRGYKGAFIYLGNGDGTFSAPIQLALDYTWGVSAGDFDNDGDDDLIYGLSPVKFYPGNGDVTFGSPTNLGFSSYPLAESDFNNDGNLDLVYTWGDYMYYRTGNGDGTFTYESATYITRRIYGLATSPNSIPLEINEGESVEFSGKLYDKGWMDTHTATWSWGDGSPIESGKVTEKNEKPQAIGEVTGSHIYSDNGEYMITLTITDDNGGFNKDILNVVVLNVAPVANAGEDSVVMVGEAFTLDGSDTYDPGSSDVLTYFWDFDDGTSGSGKNITHRYNTAGTYYVTLTVTDDDGEICKDVMTVDVKTHGEVIDGIKEGIDGMDVPKKAEKEIGKSLKELNKIIDEFNKNKTEKGIDKIEKAIEHLIKAQKKGANTQDIIDDLIGFVQDIINNRISEAEEYSDNLMVSRELEKCNKELAKAQKDLENTKKDGTPDPNYEKAIEHYIKAWEHAKKALEHGTKL